MTNPPSDIFGSLNDQGLLSRASEALVAMDMKHPVVSSASHQVFPPIKSDMMYSHPAKRDPEGGNGVLPPGEKKRKRTSIAAPEKGHSR